MATGIPYCDETWNVVAGCTRCSPACENCWAIGTTHRLAQNPALGVGEANPYTGLVARRDGRLDWTGEVHVHLKPLYEPYQWLRHRVVFVCSQADLFHPRVSSDDIHTFLRVMRANPRHTFLLLTKRCDRMATELARLSDRRCFSWWWHEPPHLYYGASVWDQQSAEWACGQLSTLGPNTWLSIEPALGRVNLHAAFDAGGCLVRWVVFGCESGPNRRPCEWDWARQVRDACQEADIPFYLKQLPGPDGRLIHAPELDGQQWLQTPWEKNEAP